MRPMLEWGCLFCPPCGGCSSVGSSARLWFWKSWVQAPPAAPNKIFNLLLGLPPCLANGPPDRAHSCLLAAKLTKLSKPYKAPLSVVAVHPRMESPQAHLLRSLRQIGRAHV